MKTILTIILIAIAMILLMAWFDKHDKEVMQSAELYEKCVTIQYGGMTPAHYYEINGEYPECDYQANQK